MAKEEQHVYTGFIGDVSPEQNVVLQQLKDHVREKMGIEDKWYDDAYLLRFCRARKFEIEKVILMFENFIKWRQENGVDEIAELDIEYIKKVHHIFPHGYYGVDKIGRPVYIERYEHFSLKKLLAVGKNDCFNICS